MLPTIHSSTNTVNPVDIFNKNINYDKIKRFFIDNCISDYGTEREEVKEGYEAVKFDLTSMKDQLKKYFEVEESKEKFEGYINSTDLKSFYYNIEIVMKLMKKLKFAVMPLEIPLDLKNEKVIKAVIKRTTARDPKNLASLPNDLTYTSLFRNSPVKKLIELFDTLINNCEQMKIESIKDDSADSFISAVSDLKNMEGYKGPRIEDHQGNSIMARIQHKDLLIEKVYTFSKKSLTQLKVLDQGILKFL